MLSFTQNNACMKREVDPGLKRKLKFEPRRQWLLAAYRASLNYRDPILAIGLRIGLGRVLIVRESATALPARAEPSLARLFTMAWV